MCDIDIQIYIDEQHYIVEVRKLQVGYSGGCSDSDDLFDHKFLYYALQGDTTMLFRFYRPFKGLLTGLEELLDEEASLPHSDYKMSQEVFEQSAKPIFALARSENSKLWMDAVSMLYGISCYSIEYFAEEKLREQCATALEHLVTQTENELVRQMAIVAFAKFAGIPLFQVR